MPGSAPFLHEAANELCCRQAAWELKPGAVWFYRLQARSFTSKALTTALAVSSTRLEPGTLLVSTLGLQCCQVWDQYAGTVALIMQALASQHFSAMTYLEASLSGPVLDPPRVPSSHIWGPDHGHRAGEVTQDLVREPEGLDVSHRLLAPHIPATGAECLSCCSSWPWMVAGCGNELDELLVKGDRLCSLPL